MKATVIGMESGSQFGDGEQRIVIRVEGAEQFYQDIKLAQSALGVFAVKIDDVLEVEFHALTMHARRGAALATAAGAGEMVIMEPRGPGKDGLL